MYWNPTGGTGHSASVPLAEPHLGLSEVTTSMEDDFFSCTFLREVKHFKIRNEFHSHFEYQQTRKSHGFLIIN